VCDPIGVTCVVSVVSGPRVWVSPETEMVMSCFKPQDSQCSERA
jgi:hypothetical protein